MKEKWWELLLTALGVALALATIWAMARWEKPHVVDLGTEEHGKHEE